MPANLTPQYRKAEEEFRKAQTAAQRLERLEIMLRMTPKHKGTDRLQADLKHRIKEVRDEAAEEKNAGPGAKSWRVPRQGAGTIVILGAPNAGKSRILKELTGGRPEIAPHPFTTRKPLPGMTAWNEVRVQLVDTPPITKQHIERRLPGMVRSADAALLAFKGASDDAPEETAEVVRRLADRKTMLDNASGFGEDDYSLVGIRTSLIVTRGDSPGLTRRLQCWRKIAPRAWEERLVELDRSDSVRELKAHVYSLLGDIRVYTKAPGAKVDFSSPLTLPTAATVEDLAAKVHRDLAAGLQYAKSWPNAAAEGLTVGPRHVLSDRDVVELHASQSPSGRRQQ